MVQVKKLESQDLLIQSFDHLTQQTLLIAPQKYKNTIAEYLFPDSTFTSSSFYKNSTPEQIEKIEGKTLQFANVSKGYFSDKGGEREAIFPIPSDAAAYGSIPFTDCRNFHEVTKAKIAIVDDVTGENSLGLEPIAAKRLVGDCYSQIDSSLHSKIEGEVNTPFQFRVGIPEQETTVARIAKGTMSPKDLSDLGVDLVLAKSSFKGRKGEENQEIKVGTYDWNLGVGIKTHAYRGEQSLGAQILVNYPLAVEALKPLIQHRLDQLKEIATEPTKLAKDYIDSIDRRYRFSAKNSEAFKEMFADDDLTKEELDVLADVAASSENEERFYHIIKADLEGHRQLLEHPAVVKVLNDHLRKQYVELATGRFVKFQAALLQPSEQLKEDEFCDPKLPDGAKVLVTRSPFLNSNNLIELTNKHLEEVKDLEGAVFMNPKTAALLQADFDGDRVAFEAVPESINLKATPEEQLHQKFLMTLAAEVREKQLPENRYADVIKKAKVPYTGSFPEVALSAKENQIGTISRMVMKAIAMENEIDFIPEAEKADYLKKVNKHFKPLAAKQELFSNWLGDAQKDPEYHSKMLEVTTSLDRQVKAIAQFDKDSRPIDEKLQIIKSFHHQLVGVLGNELQVAVDGPKSALRPDGNILNTIDALTKYREILWLDDYKSQNLYLDQPMRTSSYSPIDQMAKLVNENWAAQQLQPRKTHQFRPLFVDVSFTSEQQQKMQEVKAEHNHLYSKAHQLKQEAEEYPGPRMILSSPSGRALEVVGINESKHPSTFELEQMHVEVRLDPKSSLKYAIFALIPGKIDERGQPQFARVGYLSKKSETEQGEKIAGLIGNKNKADLGILSVTQFSPGLGKDEVKAAFNQVWDYDKQVRLNIPESELASYAAAMWSITHTRTDGTEASKDSDFRTASVTFGIFAPEIQLRLEQLQFKELEVTGIRFNEYQGRTFEQERLPISVEFSTDTNQRVVKVEGNVLGSFAGESPQLPTGTTAIASITTAKGSGVDAVTSEGKTLRVGVLKNYPYAETDFQSQDANLTFQTITNQHNRSVIVARFDKQILGEIKDVESRNYLKDKGYIDTGKPLNVALTRDAPSVAKIVVDPDTVVYPDVQIHDNALSTQEKPLPLLTTLWSQSEAGLTLAVDNRNTENLMKFFERHSVPVNFVIDARLEKSLGYAVVKFDSLPDHVFTKLQHKFGEPLSSKNYRVALLGENYKDGKVYDFNTGQEIQTGQDFSSEITVLQDNNKDLVTQLNSSPSSQLVDIIEDVAYREELTPEMELAFQNLGEADWAWLKEVTGLAIPTQRTGQEWESFSEDVFTAKFEDLLEATQNLPGMHTQQLAQLTILSHAANDLANSHPKLAESIESFYNQKVNFYENSNYSDPVKIERYLREEKNYQGQFDPVLLDETLKTLGADFSVTLARPLDANLNSHSLTQQSPEQLQVERSHKIIPIVLDYLKAKGKSFVQGDNHTAFWDASNQTLHLINNVDSEPKMTAKYLGKDQSGHSNWEIMPHTQEHDGKILPRLSAEVVEHLLLQKPKIEQFLAQQKPTSHGRGR